MPLSDLSNPDILLREKDGTLPCTEYLDLRFDEDLVCK